MNAAPTELFIVLVLLVPLGILIWAIADVLSHREAEFQAIRQDRTTWLLSIILTGIFCGLIGTAVSVMYLARIRPRLNRVRSGA